MTCARASLGEVVAEVAAVLESVPMIQDERKGRWMLVERQPELARQRVQRSQ